MSQHPRLHYHSDCDFFAGCENMIANFLNDERIHKEFDVSFSYRKTARYQQGLNSRVQRKISGGNYPLLAGNALTKYAVRLGKPIHRLAQVLNYVLLIRYAILVWNILVLYAAWRKKNINILHINNGGYPAQSSCLAAAIAARLAKIDNVIMVVNNIAFSSHLRRWSPEWLVDWLVARSVDIFVTGSLEAGKALQVVLGLANEKTITLHNGIARRANSETRNQTRSRLGLREEDFVFGIVAILEWRKGHRVLLNAIALLKESLPRDKMPVVLVEGEGPECSRLQEQADHQGISHWVHFVGTERNIYDFMQALDVVVLPSIANEDFPNVVLEAMSLGKPVVASRIAGTPEQIEDGVTGWLVKPGNAKALAHKLKEFVEDKNLAAIMGAAANKRFEAKFTAQIAVSRYLELYQSLLKRGGI